MNEQEYLNQYNARKYNAPLSTVDMAIFTIQDSSLKVLLVKRRQHPAKGAWALPGGFVDIEKDRSLDDTARRKLKEKTAVDTPYLEQVSSFGGADRDPRGWAITVAYFALLPHAELKLNIDQSSDDIAWVDINEAIHQRQLAFDHSRILECCYQRLKKKVEYTALPVNLLPKEFTLSELQKTFEIILGSSMSKKSFRKRFIDSEILVDTGQYKSGPTRPAKLYSVIPSGGDYYFNRNLEAHK